MHHKNNIESALLEVNAEEECLVCLPLGTLDRIELQDQNQSIFFHKKIVLVHEQKEESFLGSALAFERHAEASPSVFVSEVFLLVVVVLFVDQVCDQCV